jgi:ABC-type iron transport system FetAB permease component
MDSMMMADSKPGQAQDLSWVNVALALSFVSIDAILSVIFNLGIASSLIVAAGRCVLQLSVMGLVLDKVFAAGNIWGVFGIAALLNVLGAIEATFNKSKKRFHNMFPMVLLAMMSSTFPIGVLGSQYAMAERPFWKPNQFVPVCLHIREVGLAETQSSSANRLSE